MFWARSVNVFALNYGDALSLPGKGLCSEFRSNVSFRQLRTFRDVLESIPSFRAHLVLDNSSPINAK